MLDIVLAALRARRPATIALWLLVCLVIAGVTAAPCVRYTSVDRVVTQDAAAAPRSQRLITLSETVTIESLGIGGNTGSAAGIDTANSELGQALSLPGASSIDTLEVDASANAPLQGNLEYASRAGICDHVTLTGTCLGAVGDAMVSRGYATALGLHVGDSIAWTASARGTPPKLLITGIYQPIDSGDAFWGTDLLAAGQPAGSTITDAVFVTTATLEAYAQSARSVRMLVVTPESIKRYGAARLNRDIEAAQTTATTHDYRLDADFATLAARIQADGAYATTQIGVLAAELVVLGWFALYLVLRATAAARRPYRGIQLLRGVPRTRIAALVLGQDALPMLVAVPIGVVGGVLGARALTGPVPGDRVADTVRLAGIAIVAVLLGALLAATVAERRASRSSIPELLRDTPPRRRGWSGAILDLAVFAVAISAIIQARVVHDGPSGFAAAAPMLVAVAIAVLIGRLLAPAGRRFIAGGLRAGRPSVVLTATYLARRPGLDRIVILLVIGVAALGSATVSARIATEAQQRRAIQELGADRVVDLRGVPTAQVLANTRAADPQGRYLMAASAYAAGNVLAVDSPRLGAVLADGHGWPSADAIAQALAVPAPAPTSVHTGPLSLTVAAAQIPAAPVSIALDVVDASGAAQMVTFGPITTGRSDYPATVTNCPSGCAVVDLRVIFTATATSSTVDYPVSDFAAVVSTLSPVTGSLALDNRERWRTSGAIDVVGPTLSGAPGGLRVALTDDALSEEVRFDARVFPIDAPLPLPAVAAGGTTGGGSGVPTVQPFPDLTIPVDVTDRTTVLPQLGTTGMLVDLTDALRLDGGIGAGGTPQVWIRAGTPAAVVARALRGADIVSDRTTASVRAGFTDQAPAVVARFTLAAGVIALLVALIAMVLTDSSETGTDLGALRRQGLSTGALARTAAARHGSVVLAALCAGLLAAAVARLVVPGTDVVFSDGWRTPPGPHASAGGWLLALAATAVPLGVAAVVVTRRLLGRVR